MIRGVLAGFAFLIAGSALAARYLPVVNHTILIAAALSPYFATGAGVSAVLLLLNRRRLSAALALLLLIAMVTVWAPQFLGSGDPPEGSIPIRVMTANLHDGAAGPESVATAARQHADVLCVQELSGRLADTLNDRYLRSDFPYKVLNPGSWAHGVGIWSRYPIVQSRLITKFELGALTATVRPPGAEDVIVTSVHLAGPWPQPVDLWRQEIAALPETMQQLARQAGAGAAIVAGDLNASADLLPFRQLLDTGFRDVGGQSVTAPTYPANVPVPALIEFPVPPLIRIDHILTYNSTGSNPRTAPIVGSDHLALIATVHVPG